MCLWHVFELNTFQWISLLSSMKTLKQIKFKEKKKKDKNRIYI